MIKKVLIVCLFALPLLAVACTPSGDTTVTPIIETVVYYDVYELELTQEVTREIEVTRVVEVTVVVTETPAGTGTPVLATPSPTTEPTATPTEQTTAAAESATPEATTAAEETPDAEATATPTTAAEGGPTPTVPPNAVLAKEVQPLHIEASVDAPAAGLVKQDDLIVVIARTADSNWLYIRTINSDLQGFVTPSIIGLTPEQAAQRFPVLTR